MATAGLLRGFADRWRGAPEGRLFVLGLLAIGLLFLELALAALAFGRTPAQGLLSMVVVENFAGREAGIPLATQAGAPAWLIAQVSTLQDLAVVALAYPVFLYLLGRYHDRDNLVMRRLRRIERAAAQHQHFVDRWGAVGLYVFMIVPFLINGPLVGAVVGRLAGMHNRALVAPVFLATATAATAWSYGYDALYVFAARFDSRLPVALTGLILSAIILLMFVQEWREARQAGGAEAPLAPEEK